MNVAQRKERIEEEEEEEEARRLEQGWRESENRFTGTFQGQRRASVSTFSCHHGDAMCRSKTRSKPVPPPRSEGHPPNGFEPVGPVAAADTAPTFMDAPRAPVRPGPPPLQPPPITRALHRSSGQSEASSATRQPHGQNAFILMFLFSFPPPSLNPSFSLSLTHTHTHFRHTHFVNVFVSAAS